MKLADKRKTIVILGAGQMGRNAELLINQKEYRLLAFGDNAAGEGERLGTTVGYPILPVSAALDLDADLVLIAVASKDRGVALEKQARDLGYNGSIMRLDESMETFDIRSATAKRIAERINQERIPGSIAELGVYRGGFASLLNGLFPERMLYLFDTFEGFDQRDLDTDLELGFPESKQEEFSNTTVEMVLSTMPRPGRIIVRKGFFPNTAEELNDTFAFVSLDADLYAPTLAGLEWFYPRLSAGGVILLHDYNNPRFPGVNQAVADFEEAHGRSLLTPLSDMHGSAVIMRTASI